jgi:CubicO group peptidase (beta-lactamase class C family)
VINRDRSPRVDQSYDFNVGGKTYRAFAAGGNGGQFIIVFPELDMVAAGRHSRVIGTIAHPQA